MSEQRAPNATTSSSPATPPLPRREAAVDRYAPPPASGALSNSKNSSNRPLRDLEFTRPHNAPERAEYLAAILRPSPVQSLAQRRRADDLSHDCSHDLGRTVTAGISVAGSRTVTPPPDPTPAGSREPGPIVHNLDRLGPEPTSAYLHTSRGRRSRGAAGPDPDPRSGASGTGTIGLRLRNPTAFLTDPLSCPE